MERILIVCSTYGEGEMPDSASDFWDQSSADDAPKLGNTPFAVQRLVTPTTICSVKLASSLTNALRA